MADPFYAWHVGSLRDGRITHQVPLVSTSWTQVMDDAGALSGTLLLADPDVAQLNPRNIAEPARCFLAVSYTDAQGTETFLDGGPIWTHSYETSTRQLTIGAAGVWSYYDHRKVLKVLAAGVNPSTDKNVYSALSLGTIAKRLVQLAHTHTNGALPIVLPADEAGVEARTYNGYEMTSVAEALRTLTKAANGPEIQFLPRRRSDDPRFLEWVMRVGTAEQPLLSQLGPDWEFDASPARSAVGNITVTSDGGTLADRWWVQGAGTDKSTMFGRADSTLLQDAGYPLLEATDTQHAGEDAAKKQTNIDDYALADLVGSQRRIETWALAVQRDGVKDEADELTGATVASWRVGDWVSATPPADDPYLLGGEYRTRITQIAGDDSNLVQISLQPTIEVVV
jgi:hypothetical protein